MPQSLMATQNTIWTQSTNGNGAGCRRRQGHVRTLIQARYNQASLNYNKQDVALAMKELLDAMDAHPELLATEAEVERLKQECRNERLTCSRICHDMEQVREERDAARGDTALLNSLEAFLRANPLCEITAPDSVTALWDATDTIGSTLAEGATFRDLLRALAKEGK
jgi:hypothetical protein